MRAVLRLNYKSIVLFALPILLIANGCAPAMPTQQPTGFIPQTGPTAEEPTIEATQAEAIELPQIALTPVKFTAKVFKKGSTEIDVEQDQQVDVEAEDRIEVVKIDKQKEQSRSILNFPNFLEVELFTNAVVLLKDVREEAGGSTHVTLDLSRGHMFIRLSGETGSRVTVETPDSTINTLEDGTEFNICKAPDSLTCVQVKKGSVEIIAQDGKEIVRADEASFIFKDKPPSPIICAPNEIFADWEERYRQSADTPTLGSIVAGLQGPCAWQSMEIPSDARTLYQDQFTNSSSGWLQEKKDNHFIGYSTPDYYHLQLQGSDDQMVVNLPNRSKYGDANIDLKAFTGNAKSGDFKYGLVFRQSGEQYYGFAVSPSTKKWYVLKSSSNGLEIAKEGTSDSIQGLEAEDVLRVLAQGSLMTFYINGQLVYQLIDFDYAKGEVGLLVQTADSPSVLTYFDSIAVWDVPKNAPSSDPLKRENCFNNKDDDGDLFVDRDDPDCNKPDVIVNPDVAPTLMPVTPPGQGPTACSPPEEDPQCPPSNPYDPAICDCSRTSLQGGCTDPDASNFDPNAQYDDESCEYRGCTDSAATNFDPNATEDDGSCTYTPASVPGCTDSAATNFDPNATENDGSCTYPPPPAILGCTNPGAANFDPNATEDDGSCVFQ